MLKNIKELDRIVCSVYEKKMKDIYNKEQLCTCNGGNCNCNIDCTCDTLCNCEARCACNTQRVFNILEDEINGQIRYSYNKAM